MKYIEELNAGDCFIWNNSTHLITTDFKSTGSRLCYSLIDGSPRWLEGNETVELIQLYTLNDTNTIMPIKETKKEQYNV